MSDVVLLVHAFATLSMTGLIWFVQIVHYPLFARVGEASFCAYETEHQRRTGFVVGPLMLLEASTAVLLLVSAPAGASLALPLLGAILLSIIWVSTAFVQVPLHRTLERSFDERAAAALVRTNWIRSLAWTIRGCLALLMLNS